MVSSRLHLGAAYYPEHWPEERWADDIRLMQEAGMTVARMAEFAWSTMEPAEGEFDFDWLDRAIEALAEAGLVSVLGTPTAAPPAWLTQRDPETLAVDEYGRRVQHGNRCHYCVNSEAYHRATQRIVAAMAEQFGDNEHVIGWQIDNEYNRVCYCERCRALFQQYLAQRFGSLEALNEHWSTAYWSQTYSAWDQIPLPIMGPHNPGLRLAFRQFVTESYRRFQKLQLEALRPHLRPEVWVTHNFMNWFDRFDHYVLAQDLDLASWDWYVGTGHHDYLETGAAHDLVRGFKRQNFWLMETQPGSVSWASANNVLNKGEGRAMAWHAVGHGADAVLYWQWRSALGGQEQYHGTLVDPSGQPRPFYQEVQGVGKDFAKVSPLLAGSTVSKARVAIINSYDARWSIQGQPHHADFSYKEHLLHYYRPLAARNIPVDIVPPDAAMDQYRLIIAPALIITSDKLVAYLKTLVRRGRRLMLTLRCGMKDEYNALLPSRQPGALTELTGLEVEEYYALDEPVPVKGNWFEGHSHIWAERLKPLNDIVAPIARYESSNGWLDDQIGIAVNAVGSGMVYYVGMYLDQEAQQAFMDWVVRSLARRVKIEVPPGVEIRTRVTSEEEDVFIVINHENEVKTIELPWPVHEHLNDVEAAGEVKLVPYGVAIITRLPD